MVTWTECNSLDEDIQVHQIKDNFFRFLVKILPMKPVSLLIVLKTFEQCLLGLGSLLIVTRRSFSWLTLESSEPFIVYFVYWILIPIYKILHLSTFNFICHFSDQLTKMSKLNCNCIYIFFGWSYLTHDFCIVGKFWYLTDKTFIDMK